MIVKMDGNLPRNPGDEAAVPPGVAAAAAVAEDAATAVTRSFQASFDTFPMSSLDGKTSAVHADTAMATKAFHAPMDGFVMPDHEVNTPSMQPEENVVVNNEDSSQKRSGESKAPSTRKRVRRVGMATNIQPGIPPPPPPPAVAGHRDVALLEAQYAAMSSENAAAAASMAMESAHQQLVFGKIPSKHDEKWNRMFESLLKYKNEHGGSTLVPQCYDQDMRLGRWVHYQRVEYWIYQSPGGAGKAKINAERIARLESIGFEWDPQRAQWNLMYDRLVAFAREHHHCNVPKGYGNDPELANWVRNQRLEYANRNRGKRTRMNQERMNKLEAIGFKWSRSSMSGVPIRPPPPPLPVLAAPEPAPVAYVTQAAPAVEPTRVVLPYASAQAPPNHNASQRPNPTQPSWGQAPGSQPRDPNNIQRLYPC